MFLGSTRSGKSTLICDLISRFNEVVNPESIKQNGPLKRVVLIYRGHFQPIYRDMEQRLDPSVKFEHFDHLPLAEMERDSFWQTDGGDSQTCVIFDDCLNLFDSNATASQIEDAFVRKSHHLNCTIILGMQEAFRSKMPQLKTCRQNCSYLVIVRSQLCGPISIILQRELMPHKPQFLSKLFYLAFEQDNYWAIIYDQTIGCKDIGRWRAGGLFKFDKDRTPTLYFDE